MRRALTIPAALAVSALAVASGCPSDDTSDSSGSATQTTGGAELPDCPSLEDENACGGEEGCMWYPDLGICIVQCEIIGDQATCEEQGFCFWNDSTCEFGGI